MFTTQRIQKLKKRLKFRTGKDGFNCDDEDRAIINVGAEYYDDIFSPYCYKGGDTLSQNLVDYLLEKAEAIPLDYDLVVRFHVKNASEEKRQEIKEAMRENFENDIHGIEKRLSRTLFFSLWFVIIGIVFFIAYVLFYNKSDVAIQLFLDIMCWLFLWEGIDAFFLDRRLLQLERLKSYRLREAKIEIVEFEPY